MAKVVNITDKLDFEESPKLKIRDLEVTVNDSAETMLKLMGLFEDEPEAKAIMEAYALIFSESDRKKIKGLKLNFQSFQTLIGEAMELIRGGGDTPSDGE